MEESLCPPGQAAANGEGEGHDVSWGQGKKGGCACGSGVGTQNQLREELRTSPVLLRLSHTRFSMSFNVIKGKPVEG